MMTSSIADGNTLLYPALYKKISVAADRAEVSGVEPYAAVGVLLNYSGCLLGSVEIFFHHCRRLNADLALSVICQLFFSFGVKNRNDIFYVWYTYAPEAIAIFK